MGSISPRHTRTLIRRDETALVTPTPVNPPAASTRLLTSCRRVSTPGKYIAVPYSAVAHRRSAGSFTAMPVKPAADATRPYKWAESVRDVSASRCHGKYIAVPYANFARIEADALLQRPPLIRPRRLRSLINGQPPHMMSTLRRRDAAALLDSMGSISPRPKRTLRRRVAEVPLPRRP